MASQHESEDVKSKVLHEARGVGVGSRSGLDFKKLRSLGWKVTTRESGSKTFVSYTNPQGKSVKSAALVKEQLPIEETLEDIMEMPGNSETESMTMELAGHQEEDVEYEPPTKRKPEKSAPKLKK